MIRVVTIVAKQIEESRDFFPDNAGDKAFSRASIEAGVYQRIQMSKPYVDETRTYVDGKLTGVWGVGDEFLPYPDDFTAEWRKVLAR